VSIKIYEAYRVAKGVDPYEVLFDSRRRAQKNARDRLGKIMRDVLEGRSQAGWDKIEEETRLFQAWMKEHHSEVSAPHERLGLYMKWEKDGCPAELQRPDDLITVSNEHVLSRGKKKHVEGDKPGIFDIDRWMHAEYGDTLTEHEWDLWAIDVSITMRIYRGKFYVIPYCDRRCHLRGLLDFMAGDERLEDFSYWNNTDKPDEVSSQKWAWRRTVWNDLTKPERWNDYVTVDIVSWLGWMEVSPMVEVMRENNGEKLLSASTEV